MRQSLFWESLLAFAVSLTVSLVVEFRRWRVKSPELRRKGSIRRQKTPYRLSGLWTITVLIAMWLNVELADVVGTSFPAIGRNLAFWLLMGLLVISPVLAYFAYFAYGYLLLRWKYRVVIRSGQLSKAGDFKGAIETLNQALHRGNATPIIYFNLGHNYSELNENDRALEMYELAAEEAARPDYLTLTVQVEALKKLGRFDDALERMQEAVELKPGQFDAICALGTLLAEMNRYREAREQLHRAEDYLAEMKVIGTAKFRQSLHAAVVELRKKVYSIDQVSPNCESIQNLDQHPR